MCLLYEYLSKIKIKILQVNDQPRILILTYSQFIHTSFDINNSGCPFLRHFEFTSLLQFNRITRESGKERERKRKTEMRGWETLVETAVFEATAGLTCFSSMFVTCSEHFVALWGVFSNFFLLFFFFLFSCFLSQSIMFRYSL